jgi:glycosyltransferase involved in cell wall biosynthesis
MKILFICHDGEKTGAPILLLHLLRWLKANTNIQFEVLLLKNGPLYDNFQEITKVHLYSKENNEPVIKKIILRLLKKLRMTSKPTIIKKLLNTKYNLVYANTIVTGEILSELSGIDCPVITHVHELNYWIQISGKDNLNQIKKNTTHFIAASRAVKNNLVINHEINENKISVIHEFIDTKIKLSKDSNIRLKLNIPKESFVVLGSGFETWRKGKDIFVQLAATVEKRKLNIPIYYIWVGGWESNLDKIKIEHDVKTLGLESKIYFTGAVSNPIDYFQAADVFTMTSREDPFPLVCLEAASVQKPIICFSEAGGMPEFVESDSGFIVPYLDLEEMSNKIILLALNPNLCLKIGSNARNKASSFDLSIKSKEVYNVIMDTIGQYNKS